MNTFFSNFIRASDTVKRYRIAHVVFALSVTTFCLHSNSPMAANDNEISDRPSGAISSEMPDLESEKPSVSDLLLRAFYLEDKGNYKDSIPLYKEALKITPNDVSTINSIAGAYGMLKNFQEEVVWAKKAVSADPRFVPAHLNLGSGYAGLRDFDNAYNAYSKAVEIDPKDFQGYYSLGFVEESRKNWSQAEHWYRRSIEADPKYVGSHFNLAVVYANQKKYSVAIEELQRVLDLDPLAEDAKAMLSKLRNRQSQR